MKKFSRIVVAAVIVLFSCVSIMAMPIAVETKETVVERETYDIMNSLENAQLFGEVTYYEEYGVYFDKTSGTITSADKSLKSFNIPEKIDDVVVTSVAANAFKSCVAESIVLPDKITKIEQWAFAECENLVEIHLPAELEWLGYIAFENCTGLKQLTIPKLTDTLDCWYGRGELIFGCTNLKKVIIEDGAVSIPERAFANCVYFEEIVVPDSVVSVLTGAFSGCIQLTQLPTMNGVTFIDNSAFSGCKGLENLNNLPDDLKGIDSNAFENCISLKEITDLPSKLEYINDRVFQGCIGLEKVEFSGKRLTTIGVAAFSGCKYLKQVNLPSHLEELGYRAFEDCICLKNLTIPKYTDTYSAWDGQGEWIYGCVELTSVTFEAGATKIPQSAFANCKYLEEVIVPDTIKDVKMYAFQNCTDLSEIPTMNNVESIELRAFEGCTSIESLDNLPTCLKTIGNYAFSNCTGLEKIEKMPDSLETIGVSAFSGCKYIEKVILPANLLTIKEAAFSNNTYLEYIFIPESVTIIEINVFSGDSDVTIYGHLKSIAEVYANENNIPFIAVEPEEPIESKATMTLSDVSGRPGDTVKVAVSLKTDEAINTIGIKDITYDKNVLTFTGFSDYEALTDICALSSFDDSKMAVVAALKNAQVFDGNICSLNFKINETAEECEVSVSAVANIKLDSNSVVTQVVPATVAVNLQLLGDIDLNETVDLNDAILLLQYSMFPELYPIDYKGSVDFTKDGNIDMNDAILLLQYSMFPELYPIE